MRTGGLLISLLTVFRSALCLLTLLASLALGAQFAFPVSEVANLRLLALLLSQSLLLSVATRILVETSSQRIEIVGELPRAIESLFGTRGVGAARTLLRGLQTVGQVVQTSLDRALVGTAVRLLTLLTILLPALLITAERLLAFANPLRNSIACECICGVLQLSRGALLPLTLTGTNCPRRLFEILLQPVHRIRQGVFPFGQLLASLARVFILRVLTTATRKALHVLRNLTLP